MTRDTDSTADTHRSSLGAAINDGGGCTESWTAAQTVREDTDDGGHRIQTRVPRAAAAVTGTSVVAPQALVHEATAAKRKADVTEPTGDRRRALLGPALGDPQTRKIRHALVRDGDEPRGAEDHAVRTEYEGERYHCRCAVCH